MLDYQKDNNTLRKVKIYTDGACSQNGSWEGGWAFIIVTDSLVYKKNGYSKQTTNQKMELTAILEALESLKEPSSVNIYTDSMYCVNTINTWLENWLRENHSKRANFDLWTRFYELSKGHFIKAIHVRGHSTNDLNNECDELAVKGRNQIFIEDLKTF
jgi:ribonuclease HI